MTDAKLIDLISHWKILREQGEVDLQALCHDHPELLEPLKKEIESLEELVKARLQAHPELPNTQVMNPSNAHTRSGGAGPSLASLPTQAPMPQIPGYEMLKELGRGGMGVVYQARQKVPSRLVALKMILPGSQPAEEDLVRFRREVETLAELQHPNLVTIYEVGEYEGLPFFSLEYVPGGNLEDWIDGKPQDPRTSAEMVESLAHAMQLAHNHAIMHRDLKPANILLSPNQTSGSTRSSLLTLKITDFGLARKMDAKEGLTRSGSVVGTPSFMAPEQASGQTRRVTHLADIYSLGAILYNLITGNPPFQSETAWETIRQVVSSDLVPPRSLHHRIPTDLETICLKCLEKRPERRYETAQDLADDLRSFLEHGPIKAKRAGMITTGLRLIRRHPAIASILSILALSLGVLIGGSFWYNLKLSSELDKSTRLEKQNRRQLIDLFVDRGAQQLNTGDPFRALVWFAEALKLDQDFPWQETPHRIRLNATLQTSPILEQMLIHKAPIRVVHFNSDGQLILTGSIDGVVRVWSSQTGEQVGKDLILPGVVMEAKFRPGHDQLVNGKSGSLIVAVAWEDGTALLWDVMTHEQSELIHSKSISLTALCFRNDGQFVATGSEDGTVKIWNAETGKPVGEPLRHPAPLRDAEFSPDGTKLVTGSDDGTLTIWKTTPQGAVLHFKRSHKKGITDVEFSANSKMVVSASEDHTARIWDAETGEELHQLEHRRKVISARFRSDNCMVATSSEDRRTCLWSMVDDKDPDNLDGKELSAKGTLLRRVLIDRSTQGQVRFGRGNHIVASGSESNVARVWSVHSTETLTPYLPHNGGILAMEFSPNDKILATAGNDQIARIWNLSHMPDPSIRAQRSQRLQQKTDQPWLCPHEFHEAFTATHTDLQVVNHKNKNIQGPLLKHGSKINFATFDPKNDDCLLSCSDDNNAYLWDWKEGKLLIPPMHHESNVIFGKFSENGKLVVTLSEFGNVRVWNPMTGHLLTPSIPYSGELQRIRFDDESKNLILTVQGKPLTINLEPLKGSVEKFVKIAEMLSTNRIEKAFVQPLQVDELKSNYLPLHPDYLRLLPKQ